MTPLMNRKTTSFDDLPEEMTVNIFLRLPVKALIRSTSVNKKWSKGEQFREVTPGVEVFSLKDCTWRKLKDNRVPRISSEYGTFVNGSYYWLRDKLESKEEEVEEMWIVSFDFDKEVFGELRLPDEVSYCLGESARFRLIEFEGSLAVCVTRIDNSNGVASSPHCIWLMSHEKGVISWTLRFRIVLEKVGWPMNITKSGTLILETYPLRMLEVTKIVSCNLNTLHYKDLGFCKLGGSDGNSEDSRLLVAPCVAYTSFLESLAMFEGGKSLLKPIEEA